jgi:hypothetical protein
MWPFDTVLFTEGVLPFVLIFVLVFAILQKTKLLGEGKKQIDSLVAMVIGLITVGFTYQTGLIVNFVSWLGIGLAVLLIFFILYGFVAADGKKGLEIENWMKWTFLGLISLFVAGVVLYTTGLWDKVLSGLGGNNEWATGIIMIVIIGVVVAVVLSGKKNDD